MFNLPLLMVKDLYIKYFSSHKAGDYESCDEENNVNHCLKCDSNKHRYLLSAPAPSKCICEDG